MVAVPGGSKGCTTCRKRRVKCDEAKPTCQRCPKAGYKCLGYERPLKIRFASVSNDKETTKREPRESSVADSDSGEGPSSRSIVTTKIKFSSPPLEMNLTGFRDEMCQSYLYANFVWRTYGTPWLDMSVQGQLGPLPLFTSKALAWSHFGESHDHLDTRVKGGNMHGKVLTSVAGYLSNPDHPGFAIVIVPLLMILIHSGDVLTSPHASDTERQNSRAHVKGIEEVLTICGPARFQSPPLRAAFDSCRASIITAALMNGQRCFLEQDPWRLLPWAPDPTSQTPQSQLANIFVFVPGFVQDEATLNLHSGAQLHINLVHRVITQLEMLFTWRWQWEQANESMSLHLGQDGSRLTPPGTRSLSFGTLEKCIEILTYDMVYIWLLGLLWKLEPDNAVATVREVAANTYIEPIHSLQDAAATGEALGLPGSHTDIRQVAIEIVGLFDLQLQNIRSHSVSSLFFLLPIGLAWSVLCDDMEWSETITQILARNEITRGYRTERNMFGFGPYAHLKGAMVI